MNRKFVHGQEAFRGILTQDFDKVAEEARAISLPCLDEHWNRVLTQDHLERS